jgi:glutathione S-transferase
MELYFAPLACSMATRIALYEAGGEARFTQVDTRAKRIAEDGDFLAVNPMGQVPALRTEEGEVLTENPVVLQYVADRFPAAGLAPAPGGIERYKLQKWLNFIATELHKAVFIPLLERSAPEGAKAYALEKAEQRFAFLEKELSGREFLLDRFTVADAYLVTVLNWTIATPQLKLERWPAVRDWYARMSQRPSVARALAEELALYKEERARRAA